jgi:hypothetical protein
MGLHMKLAGGALALAAAATAARAELPPQPASIKDQAVLACVRMDAEGKVSGAYLMSSTGDAARDADFLAWIKQLKWAKPEKRDRTIDQWLPMGLALGKGKAPPSPKTCDPPRDG